jgi:hypothetical protein
MMKSIGTKLGVAIMLTTKRCHAEIAGDGMEYIWAAHVPKAHIGTWH